MIVTISHGLCRFGIVLTVAVVAAAFCLTSPAQANWKTAQQKLPGRTWDFEFGSVLGRPNFAINNVVDVDGIPARFFTGKPQDYLGWSFGVRETMPFSRHFSICPMAGIRVSKTGYWLNWEHLGARVSLDPMRSSLSVWYTYFGVGLSGRLGPFGLTPSLSIPVGQSMFTLTPQGGVAETGTDLFSGIQPGIDLRARLIGRLSLTAGYRATALVKPSPRYKVEEAVTLRGSHSGLAEELHLTLTLSRSTP